MKKKIIIIKTGGTFPDIAARRGDFEDWAISGMGVDREMIPVLNVFDGNPSFPGYQFVAGILITGSHDMVTDHPEWSERTGRWLKAAVARHIPILGICYGHQLLAHCLGGRVADNPNGLEFGTVEIKLTAEASSDRLFRDMAGSLAAHVTHTQSVTRLPEGATLLAASQRDPHQAFVLNGNAWGVQFHPEFDAEITREYIHRMQAPLIAQGEDPGHLVQSCQETPESASILNRFARMIM